MGRKTRRTWPTLYLRGLLGHRDHKSLRPMAACLGLPGRQSNLSPFFAAASRKKSMVHVPEQDRPGVRAAREAWFAGQLDLDPDRLASRSLTRPQQTPPWPNATGALRAANAVGGARPSGIEWVSAWKKGSSALSVLAGFCVAKLYGST